MIPLIKKSIVVFLCACLAACTTTQVIEQEVDAAGRTQPPVERKEVDGWKTAGLLGAILLVVGAAATHSFSKDASQRLGGKK